MTDPISDMLTRIRNAQAVHKENLDIPFSNLKLKIAGILAKENFIKEFKKVKIKNQRYLRVYLKYDESGRGSAISGLRRVSKPGQRIYKKTKEIKRVKDGFGLAIISTPKGVLTDKEARKQKLGGEVICEVW